MSTFANLDFIIMANGDPGSPVPTPATAALLLAGAAGLGLSRKLRS